MNTLVKIIIGLILLYGLASSVYYIEKNGFTAATGFFVAQFADNSPGFYRSSPSMNINKCKDECYNRDTACQGNRERVCIDSNNDGCTEWSPSYPCIGKEICGINKCGDLTENNQLKAEAIKLGNSITKAMPLSRCLNECNPGDRTTIKGKFYKVCGTNFDQDPCYEWSPDYTCPEETRVRKGKCERFNPAGRDRA